MVARLAAIAASRSLKHLKFAFIEQKAYVMFLFLSRETVYL